MDSVAKWLEQLGLGQYASLFTENAIDEDVLPELTDADLEKLGVKLGHRKRLLKAIAALQAIPSQPLASSTQSVEAEGPRLVLKFGSPDTYTPKHLAEKILAAKSSLEGERKQVTVLFADIKGSTELIAERDPEEADQLLNPILERMMEAVHRFEGTVTRVMGDGIMALFGAPLAHEDHAIRACYAALRMQETIRRYSEQLLREQGLTVQIRVGLNSGEVVVRNIGNDLYMEYTAMGHTAHLAARMEQLATPGNALLTADTLKLVEGLVHVETLGPVPVKGLTEPVEVYELTRAAAVRSRFQAAALRGFTRFVGRDNEMEQLRQALERARSGHGQVAAVVGEPGVGKSRLFWEFTHSHRTQGWLIVETSSVSYGKASAFLPIIDLLRSYFQIEAHDEERRIRERVTGKLLSLDRQLEPCLPAILWLLEVPVEDPQWQRLDPPQRRRRILDGVKRLLLRETQVQPLLLLFEDLHWIDAETQALLDSLVESLPTARLLLMVNYRPEYQHGWGSKTYYRQLRLDPLVLENAEELLSSLLGHDPGLVALKRLLIDRTEGNPFFLEESVRTLVETKVLTGERGAYQLAKTSRDLQQTVQIPTTATTILAARIDRLPQEDKRLLQAASVIGKHVPLGLLQAIADVPEEALHRTLIQLQAAEFLYEALLFPDLEYTFKHALTHEVAYDSLLHDRRRALHGRIVEALERLYPERLTEHVEQLAHHAFRAELWEKAVRYLRRAGAKALARSANRDAAAQFEQALAALTHLPETHEAMEQAIDLRFDLRNSLFPLAEFERVFQYLHDAERLATTLDDPRRLGWVCAYMSSHLSQIGRPTEALTFAQRTDAIADTLGDFALMVAANFYLGWACLSSGDYRRAGDFLGRMLESLKRRSTSERLGHLASPAVMSRSWLAVALAERGDFAEGIAHGEEGIRIAEALDHPFSLAIACRGLGHLAVVKGDLGLAVRVLERGLTLSHDWTLPFFQGSLGCAYALSGRVDEGLSSLEHALRTIESTGAAWNLSLMLLYHGEACVLAGRLEQALLSAERSLTLTREGGQRGDEAYALRLHGDILARRDPADVADAEEHYRQALALAEELGMRPLVAHCHLGLGRLYQQTKNNKDTKTHLTRALELFREMDMGVWLERAEAEAGGTTR